MVLEGSITDSYKKDDHDISKEKNQAKVSSQKCVGDKYV